jgi:FlaA1/EpsC-like NDP-sugar epimerase
MTIPEACQLVLEAGVMGTEVKYIFDMGKPVKIIDLARKMTVGRFCSREGIKIQIVGPDWREIV